MKSLRSSADRIRAIASESIEAKRSLVMHQSGAIEKAAKAIIAAFRRSRKVIVFGNGGSAADSQHIAAELVGRFQKERAAYPAISLTTNTSILTAIANDYSYEITFERQVEALAVAGDVVLAISTSGNAANVIAAVRAARKRKCTVIGLTGGMGGKLSKEADIVIAVPSKVTARIQESHIMVAHIICELVEDALA